MGPKPLISVNALQQWRTVWAGRRAGSFIKHYTDPAWQSPVPKPQKGPLACSCSREDSRSPTGNLLFLQFSFVSGDIQRKGEKHSGGKRMQAARADRASLFLSCPLGIFGLCLNWLILYSPASLLAVGEKKKCEEGKKKKKRKPRYENLGAASKEIGRKICAFTSSSRQQERKKCWDLPAMRTWICCDSKPIFFPCTSQPSHA